MKNKRLFIAIDIPFQVKENLHNLASRVLKDPKNTRFVKAENIHITIKFLGSVPIKSINKIEDAISTGTGSLKSFSIKINGEIGAFPRKKRARTVFAGINEGKRELESLYMNLEEALEEICTKLGIKAGRKDFKAHITLARLHNPEDIEEAVNKAGILEPVEIYCKSIVLFESILNPAGVRYTKLKEFSLK